MPPTSARGNTVRLPPGPSRKSAGAADVVLISARIFSKTAVTLWVVKTLAATTWPRGTILASSICVSAFLSDVR